jgi:hypothetical protein
VQNSATARISEILCLCGGAGVEDDASATTDLGLGVLDAIERQQEHDHDFGLCASNGRRFSCPHEGDLPLVASIFGLTTLVASIFGLTTIVIVRTLVLNVLGGFVFGALCARGGLERAMVGHFASDIVLHVALGG